MRMSGGATWRCPFRLIAFDLDGTLLDKRKQLPPDNLRLLRQAGEQGVLLVPATGRIPEGLPEVLRDLPGLRCGIMANGAFLYDFERQCVIDREEIPLPLALEALQLFDTLPVLYDCYQNSWGYIGRDMLAQIRDYVSDPGILDLIERLRTPVDSLYDYLAARGEPVQKMQLYMRDPELRLRLLRELPERFPALSVTSSLPVNIELNSVRANKGDALLRLCAHLGIDPADCVAFGDGTNDLSLLRTAGVGVAMANAEPSVKAVADLVTGTNDEAGVAMALYQLAQERAVAEPWPKP